METDISVGKTVRYIDVNLLLVSFRGQREGRLGCSLAVFQLLANPDQALTSLAWSGGRKYGASKGRKLRFKNDKNLYLGFTLCQS